MVIMLWLSLSEFSLYRTTETGTHLVVDAEQIEEATFSFVVNVALLSQKCPTVRVYLRDSKGRMLDIPANDVKLAAWVPPALLQADPNYRPARDDAPGCMVTAMLKVPKVAGEFRIQSKDMPDHAMQMNGGLLDLPPFNSSHLIQTLRFGPAIPGQAFPLDGVEKAAQGKHINQCCTWIGRGMG